MSYVKQDWNNKTWAKGQQVLQDQLNHMEDGIANSGSSYSAGEGIAINNSKISVSNSIISGAELGRKAVQPSKLAAEIKNVKTWVEDDYYNKELVDKKISEVVSVKFEVVDKLPDVGESNIVYFVPAEDSEQKNVYDEFVWTNSDWERIGSTKVDISGKADKSYVDEEISKKQDKIDDLDALSPEGKAKIFFLSDNPYTPKDVTLAGLCNFSLNLFIILSFENINENI